VLAVATATLDDELSLLYVGISPVREASRRTIRSRVIGNHLNGNVGSSTFRFILAALLIDALELRPLLHADQLGHLVYPRPDGHAGRQAGRRASASPRPGTGSSPMTSDRGARLCRPEARAKPMMEKSEPDVQELSQATVTALLAQYRESSAHHLLSNTLIWQLPAATITISGILVAAMFAYDVPDVARVFAAAAGALFVFAMTVAVERYRMLQLYRRRDMGEIERRLAPLGIAPIPWAASQVVQEIDAGQFQASGLRLYRIDGFNVLRALMYGMTILLVALAGVALLDAFGADLIS